MLMVVGDLLKMSKLCTTRTQLEQLGKKIKMARIAADLSREELGAIVYLQRDCIGRLERGEQEPGVLTLRSIAAALAKPVEWFLG